MGYQEEFRILGFLGPNSIVESRVDSVTSVFLEDGLSGLIGQYCHKPGV